MHDKPEPMDPNAPLQIANRIRLELLREIAHGIVVERLLSDRRYARDVLFVCDALHGTTLPALARSFRQMAEEQGQAARKRSSAAPSATWSPTP